MPSPRARASLRRAVLAWYDRCGRTLAFRATSEPWAVLVAEVMLQQTQAARVDTALPAFLARWPTPDALAAASPAEVLRAWGGLGYGRRAVNLQRAARAIVERHGGEVPSDTLALEALPGVGPYTARAVAAIAFDRPVAGVDTNVRRVVGRIVAGHGHPGDPAAPLGRREMQEAADALMLRTDPARWTHASMDLGASVCRPRRPRCEACPARRWCTYGGSRAAAPTEAPRRPMVTPGRPDAVPWDRTRRWLRGRILERLREAPDARWVAIPAPLGAHDEDAVRSAIAAMASDGLLERGPDGLVRLPSSAP